MSRKTVSVVVPVYFNADSLPLLFSELLKIESQLAERGIALELIFVDDGSQDESLQRLLEFKHSRPATKIVKLTRNFGAMHCCKTGYQFVTGDAFMNLAADLQDPPELIVQMADRWLAGSKFIICERNSRADPLLTRLWAFIFYTLLRIFVLPSYPRGGYDLALFDSVMLPHLRMSSKSAFMPLLAYWLGYKPDTILYHRQARLHGKSRWTFSKKLHAFLDAILGFSIVPLRIISGLGAIVALCSFGYASVVILNAVAQKIPVPGFATAAALLAFLLGLIILMLGLIGEYVWRIFDDTNKRPETVIEEVW